MCINIIDKLIGTQGARLLREERPGETPYGAERQGGSPHAPRKASNLEWKSTTLNSAKGIA